MALIPLPTILSPPDQGGCIEEEAGPGEQVTGNFETVDGHAQLSIIAKGDIAISPIRNP